jgi:hypothetical protein
MKQMFTDTQLRNFEHYVRTTPKALLGLHPITPRGAYDALNGARGHGFGHRRGIDMKHFRKWGAYDAENGGMANENTKKALEALTVHLQNNMGDQEFQHSQDLINELMRCCSQNADGSQGDDDPDAEAMDDPAPFRGSPRTGADPQNNTLVRNNSNSSLPNRANAGSAMDSRQRPVTRAAAESFAAMFPNASPVKHV